MAKTLRIQTGTTTVDVHITETALDVPEATVTMHDPLSMRPGHAIHRAGDSAPRWMDRVEAHLAGFMEGQGVEAAVARKRAAQAVEAMFAWHGADHLTGPISQFVQFVR